MSIAWPSAHHDVPSAPLLPAARSRRALGLLALLAGGLLVAGRLTGGPDQPAPAPRADAVLRALPVLSGAAQADFIGIEPRARADEPVITPMETVGAAPD